MSTYKYITTIEAAKILKKSRRSAHNTLQCLFQDYSNDKDYPFAKVVRERNITRNVYRLDKVLELVDKPRVSKYKKKCVQCGKKFLQINKENICLECTKLFSSKFLEDNYTKPNYNPQDDIDCFKALMNVLTDDYWWKVATKIVVIGSSIAVLLLIGGCCGVF